MTAVAMVGTGNMGTALGASLLAKGHQVFAWNRTAERAAGLTAQGAHACVDLRDAIARSEVVVICLLDQLATTEALEAGGIGREELRGKLVVQLSMRSAGDATAFSAWIAEQEAEYLDGFIKSYPRDIGTERSVLHYSGSRQAFDRWLPALQGMGPARFISEDVEMGVRLNTVGVLLLGAVIGAYYQAAAVAEALGAPDDLIVTVLDRAITISTATFELARQQGEHLDVKPATEASIAVHLNSLKSNLDTLQRLGLEHEYAALATRHLELAEQEGLGPYEAHALWRHYRQPAGR